MGFGTNNISNRIDGIYTEIISKFDSYENLTKKVSEFLKDEMISFEKRNHGIPESLIKFDAEVHPPEIIDEYWDLSEAFPNIQRRSELMSVYSLLEDSLNKICEAFERFIKNPIKINDLSSRNILIQYKSYLEKVVIINFPDGDNSSWEEIINIQEIRNSFIHKDGTVKLGNGDLRKYVLNSNFLCFIESNIWDAQKKTFVKIEKMIIKDGFTVHCISVFVRFLVNVLVSCPSLVNVRYIIPSYTLTS